MAIDNLVTDARSVLTVVSLLTFVGIVFWAYSARRNAGFEEAANLPFADEEDANLEKPHG